MAKTPFQRLTIVRLVTKDPPAPNTPDDHRIQVDHIKYLGDLIEKGVVLANGPVRRVDDSRLRGMTLYLVGIEEARNYANADPAVIAGWFEIVADEWLIPVRPRAIADRADLEIDVPE
ncbi:MAG TPA: hypothetical protein PKA27_08285 [Fimbriimonadaceae bacterium]|nr:hypothetical protein [Fimbriimonadaceae bacterium]